MKLIIQILFFFLTWFANLANATPVFAKIVFQSYELAFSKTENVKDESVVKIGEHNFARSGIEENLFYQKSILRVSDVLVVASRAGEREVVSRAGSFGKYATKLDNAVTVLQKESLFGNDALTFLDVEYRTVQSAQQVTSYRAFGGNAKVGGSFVTTKAGATKAELALLDEWNNQMRFEASINIPKHTKLNIGKIGPQINTDGLQKLASGADQFILPYKWDNNWVTKIVDKTTGKIYNSVGDFKVDFPDLVD